MKKRLILVFLLLSTTFFAQTTTYKNFSNSILSDSSDLPTGIWNAGFSGGPVSFGIYSDSYIYFTQGVFLFKAEEGTDKIETLVNKKQIAGSYEVTFDASTSSATASSLSSGMYLYKLQSGTFSESNKILLIK